MGLVSDFFLADEISLASIDLLRRPATDRRSVQAKGVEVVKLVQLQCIVDGSKFEDHLDELRSLLVRSASEDGPWVFSMPKPITKVLTSADDTTLQRLSEAWARTEEWSQDGATAREIASLLNKIAALARSSTNDEAMYVWVSL